MNGVAEFSAAKRIVAEILNDGAAVRVCAPPSAGLVKGPESREQKRLDLIGPEQVYDLLVR